MKTHTSYEAVLLFGTLILPIFLIPPAKAGVGLDRTRLIYDGKKKAEQITFNNTGGRFLVQAAVLDYTTAVLSDCFAITPPIFTSFRAENHVLRVLRAGCTLPDDRESLFLLRINAIPSSSKDAEHNKDMRLRVSLGVGIKLFYRPSGLKISPAQAGDDLQFLRAGHQLVVWNPSPYYLTFDSIRVNGVALDNPSMVPPYARISWTLPKGHAQEEVSWTLIDDYGNTTTERKRQLPPSQETANE